MPESAGSGNAIKNARLAGPLWTVEAGAGCCGQAAALKPGWMFAQPRSPAVLLSSSSGGSVFWA